MFLLNEKTMLEGAVFPNISRNDDPPKGCVLELESITETPSRVVDPPNGVPLPKLKLEKVAA
jgi:hypothetical protein